MSKISFSSKLENAISNVADTVASDAAELGITSRLGLAELVADADRLFMNGYKEENKELNKFFDDNKYKDVLKKVAECI